jgi:hypothetical protein
MLKLDGVRKFVEQPLVEVLEQLLDRFHEIRATLEIARLAPIRPFEVLSALANSTLTAFKLFSIFGDLVHFLDQYPPQDRLPVRVRFKANEFPEIDDQRFCRARIGYY